MPKANVSICFEQGRRGSYGGFVQTSHEVENLTVNFTNAFCAHHPHTDSYGNGSGIEICESCDAHTRTLAREEAERFWDERRMTLRLDCSFVDHDHDCRCWRGHDCDTDPCYRQARLRHTTTDAQGNPLMDDDGKPLEPNEMMVLAAEAPGADVLSISQRLASLERENRALKSILTRLIEVLPEDAREAIGSPEILA